MRPFTDDRREALRARVRAFAAGLPRRGKDPGRPREILTALGESGLLRLCVPAAFGGDAARVEPLSLVVAREELSFASGLADALFAVQGLGSHCLVVAGSPELCGRWLPAVARGEAIAAFAVTEAEAGSDLGAVTTLARRDGDGWILDGHKIFISNAGIADFYLVLARTAAGQGHKGGFSIFFVPAAYDGVECSPQELLASHPVGSVRFREVQLPPSALIGAEGQGLALCLGALEMFRPTVGAAACGLALRAFDEARRRVTIRRQFGAPLAANQSVRFALAEMSTDLQAARLLVYRAAWCQECDDSPPHALSASSAKLYATEMAQRVVDQSLQLHGAAGLVRGSTTEALYREVRALRIYEGTSEIQKLVIARELLPEPC